jgi:membrane-bound lytic murein transglycosylase F
MIYSGIRLKKTANQLINCLLLLVIFAVNYSCEGEAKRHKPVDPAIEGMDLPAILKKGKLTVLAENSSTSYFIYRGKKMGFEYEILKEFANELGVDLEIITISNLDDIQAMLNSGEGDLLACNYTITNERKKDVDFSIPFLMTNQVLVQRKPDGWESMSPAQIREKLINDPTKLARQKVHVWDQSSYFQRLIHLEEEIGDTIFIQSETGDVSSEDLIEKVSDGTIDYTVVEKNVAQVNSRFFDNLDIQLELSVKQKIGFALRKTSPLLKARLNQWLTKFTQKVAFKYMKHKYFELSQITKNTQSEFSSLGGGQISKYDALFQKEAQKYDWDWKLIAALAYQESKFNPDAVSFGGAYSMMQFMPEVGPKYGVYPGSPPEIQIAGGVKKLHADFRSWPDIPDKTQRQKFALASYNAGKGHIKDAQRLAEKHGLDPKVWDDNVEEMVKNLSKREFYRDEVVQNGSMRGAHTHKYVRSIFSRFETYKTMFR